MKIESDEISDSVTFSEILNISMKSTSREPICSILAVLLTLYLLCILDRHKDIYNDSDMYNKPITNHNKVRAEKGNSTPLSRTSPSNSIATVPKN